MRRLSSHEVDVPNLMISLARTIGFRASLAVDFSGPSDGEKSIELGCHESKKLSWRTNNATSSSAAIPSF
jgi:hypothetical protein